MAEAHVGTSHNTALFSQSAHWYHAVQLTERLASRQHISDQLLVETGNMQRAEELLQRWKEQKPFQTGSFFADRLAMDGLTEKGLLALLAEPIESVQTRIAAPASPYWVKELAQAFSVQSSSPDMPLLPTMEDGKDQHMFAFLHPFSPLLQRGILRLQTGIEALSQQYVSLSFDPQTIVSLLLPNLARQILPRVDRTLVLELNIARLRGRLQGQTPEERFENYLQLLHQSDEIVALLQEYCVMARQLVIDRDLWVDFSLEFLGHLCADWKHIRTLFSPASDPGVLTGVHAGAGDTHRGGRSVILLQFASGLQLVYKPRSLAIDVHFQELLIWLNEHDDHPACKTIKLLNKGLYGWSEFIHSSDCSSEEEVRRFYERQGGYLALLNVLGATDFHVENLIAAGEYPYLIDLEALLRPRMPEKESSSFEYPANEALEPSVLWIGLLPQRSWSRDDALGIDISGLGGQAGQLLPDPFPRWEKEKTDEMYRVQEHIKTSGGPNRPRINDQDVQTSDYCDQIVQGFTAIYRFFMTHRDEFLTRLLPRFAHDNIRFVARATKCYDVLLTESFHPNKLRDALKRERLFDHLWKAVPNEPYLSRLIPAERTDLLNGDIPLFTTHPDCPDLISSRGEVIPDFFAESGLECARKRVEMLDEEDLVRQIWMIRASFASMPLTIHDVGAKRLRFQPSQSVTNRKPLLLAAQAIGDRLRSTTLSRNETAGWLCIALVEGREWSLLPDNISLYSGTPGIALFLSYLGKITGETCYIALAKSTLQTIRSHIQWLVKEQPPSLDIGAFDGWGGLIYLFSHLSVLLKDPSLLREAEKMATFFPELIAKDEKLDIMTGSAGAIASLLSLYAVAPSVNTLAIAVQCGDHLLACAQPMHVGLGWKTRQYKTPLPGFLHGAAGISWSLLKLARMSGEERFRLTAIEALKYEYSLFSPEQRQWLPLQKSEDQTASLPTWCHGAPGIGLARLDSLNELDSEQIREEIDMALKTTLGDGFGLNHSLCHGDFGNLETALVASQVLCASCYREQVEHITAMLLDSIDSQGWITGVPFGVETPGLMTGLAGIGYQLLRLAESEHVPSVLLLKPPCLPDS